MIDCRPFVSVVIPAFESSGTVRACLAGLRAQTYREFETIVVNSSPGDGTSRIITAEFPEVRLEENKARLLPHAARNRGVELARGTLLTFTDPDCIPRAEWLDRLVQARRRGHPVVGGGMSIRSRRVFERAIHLCKFAEWLPGLSPGPRRVLPTANVLYDRSAFERVGGFSGNLVLSDVLTSWQARREGLAPWFEPSAVVDHHHLHSLSEYCREFFSRGREFGRIRIEFESWTRARGVAYAVLFPALVLVVVARAGVFACAAGWGRTYLTTLPVQMALRSTWLLGEVISYARFATRGGG